ncbi:DUF5677 domain-containing protein [Streptomyces sp. NPDC055709]
MKKPTPQQYREAIGEIIADYRKGTSVPARERNRRAVLLGHGWCAEVHRLAEAALTLIDNGFRHESLILVRTAWEMTISLHWLAQKGDKGAEGVFSEGARQSQALVKDMATASYNVPQSVLDAINEMPVNKTDEQKAFRQFQAQCDAIDPNKDLYAAYRHLSSTAHPSDQAAYPFLDVNREPPALLMQPKDGALVTEVILAQVLIWAGRAFDEMTTGKPRKQFLQRKARELDLKTILPYLTK